MPRYIVLTEDNLGALMIGVPSIGWWDVTELQNTNRFNTDAQAILDNDIADWTVQHYPHDSNWFCRKDVKVVAVHDPGSVYNWRAPIIMLGSAATSYLGLNVDWTN